MKYFKNMSEIFQEHERNNVARDPKLFFTSIRFDEISVFCVIAIRFPPYHHIQHHISDTKQKKT